MAALLTTITTETAALDAADPRWRSVLAQLVWRVYDTLDPDQPLVTVKKWVFSYTVRVRDARPLLALLVGEPQ